LNRIDSVVTATQFTPPADLTDSRAAVKLLVTAVCENEPASVTEQAAWFYVDRAPACPAIEKISFANPGRVEWTRHANAIHYEVTFNAYPQGRIVAGGKTTATTYALPVGVEPLLVSVRPRCDTALGPAAYGFLPAAR